MRSFANPAKVLQATATLQKPHANWPFPSGSADTFWEFGDNPSPYQWELTLSVVTQNHSKHSTREPFKYNGLDVNVGDYVADAQHGMGLSIVSIISKTEDEVVVIVEDTLRYNTHRDPLGTGVGIFPVPSVCVIFSVADTGHPMLDPLPPTMSVSPSFFIALTGRFQNFAPESVYVMHIEDHGMSEGDTVAVQHAAGNTTEGEFKKFDGDRNQNPIGKVVDASIGPDDVVFEPFQKIVRNITKAQVGKGGIDNGIYGDETRPRYLILEPHVPTVAVGAPFSVTTQDFLIDIGGYELFVPAGTDAQGVEDLFWVENPNAELETDVKSGVTEILPSLSLLYGASYIDLSDGEIEVDFAGETIVFKTTTAGNAAYGTDCALAEDIVKDINASNGSFRAKIVNGNRVAVMFDGNTDFDFPSAAVDAAGTPIFGAGSCLGFPLEVRPSSDLLIQFERRDASGLIIRDVMGTGMAQLGLISTENGTNAIGIVVDEGIRTPKMLSTRHADDLQHLKAIDGDQCFVRYDAAFEWSIYMMVEGQWVKIATEDSAATDSQTITTEITIDSGAVVELANMSVTSRVTQVVVEVVEAFDGDTPDVVITVDTDDQTVLMSSDHSDLRTVGVYSITPNYMYDIPEDQTEDDIRDLFFYVNTNFSGSTVGKLIVSITYT